jgi:predicted secreted hydrolase
MKRKSVVYVLLIAGLVGCGPTQGPPQRATASGLRFLSTGAADGFAAAITPRTFSFPADHGPHPRFRTEWWYFTGNLESAGGRHFGFELTFFRYALSPELVPRASHWGANNAWMAHFAVTDTHSNRFVAHERLARGALELAGAHSDGIDVWVESWSARTAADETVRLEAAAEGEAIDLALRPLKPPVLQGDQGLDRKGPEAGNASYYYSIPRFTVTGTVAVADAIPVEVVGTAWLDREWATSALSDELSGWDWFALQLDDGRDIMYYRLRSRDGTSSPYSGGSISLADGTVVRLGPDDVTLQARDVWQSPRTGTRYPVAWRMLAPAYDLDLEIAPTLSNQEIDLSVRYWEGAVTVSGSRTMSAGNTRVSGRGYLELAGY